MSQRFFLATFTGTDDLNKKNRVLGLFSNQSKLIDAIKTAFKNDFENLYLTGSRKNLAVSNANLANKFVSDGHAIIYKNNIAFIKIAIFHMNELNQNLVNAI